MTPFALAAIAALQLAQPAQSAPPPAVPKQLLTLGDNVKVRAAPSADGALNGYLYKNMVVEVLERGARPEVVGGVEEYWYRVSRGALSGWSFGSFFTAKLPAHPIDTYDLPDLDDWWGNRFGWSTEYYENGALPAKKLGKLEMDDYRGLILMAKQGGEFGKAAWMALLSSLYPFLKKHPDDPKWQYLRDRAWDPVFVGEMASNYGDAGLVEALPNARFEDPEFKRIVCYRAGAKLPLCMKPAPPPR